MYSKLLVYMKKIVMFLHKAPPRLLYHDDNSRSSQPSKDRFETEEILGSRLGIEVYNNGDLLSVHQGTDSLPRLFFPAFDRVTLQNR